MAARCSPLKTPTNSTISKDLASQSLKSSSVARSVALNGHYQGVSLSARSQSQSKGGLGGAEDGNDPEEVTSGVRTLKGPLLFRVLVLVALAGIGIYFCMFDASYRMSTKSISPNFSPLYLQQVRWYNTVRSKSFVCPQLPAFDSVKNDSDTIVRHYPRPVTFSRQGCACSPVHNFVILSMQRSGSGWFETLLNNHPNISSHGEIFSVQPRRKNFSIIHETLDKIYNLDWMSSAAKNSCTNAVGLKWMLNQGAMEFHDQVANYFLDNHVSIIVLLRRNALKRLISILANAHDRKMKLLGGKHKSHVHSHEEAKKLAEFKPELNVKHLAGNLQRVLEIADDAVRVFNRSRLILVHYEEVVRNRKLLNKVLLFLGVPLRRLSSRQVKIHTKPLREQIENYDAVERKLKGTPYEKFLTNDD